MIAYNSPLTDNFQEQESLITDHIELVKRIAYHLIGRLPAHTEVDDLLQYGMMGLLEAANNYDASRGSRCSLFAGFRMR